MRRSHWCASLAALGGLTGSLMLGASLPSAAAAHPGDSRTTGTVHALSATPGPKPAPGHVKPGDGGGSDPSRACRGLVPDPIPPRLQRLFFCGDWRLGPRRLPTRGALGNILDRYERLGRLTAVKFLDKWWDPTADSGQGDWRYPPDDGYTHRNGTVLATPLVLHAGLRLDRFGSEAGRFLAPEGTKYGKRVIPPSSLNTMDPRYPYNYHTYRLAKDVTVCAGKTAPGFEQPGLGTQYVTSSRFCPDIPRTTVADLVSNGTLVRTNG
ncbi:TNT domain-containing protein [Streptomyces sp. NBC_00328]|uniref:TNT domain-containing protein n=1 Tax=Streptomyces sp. NBC_00328 TaxID=2903646 RepID=UPI002E28B70B|nr:TNT domain-containing protein [Streptomyces sp. NBC_00328]